MTQHFVLSINPQAQYEWERQSLRNPINGAHPDFTAAIAQAVGNEPGTYLIAVKIDVQVLEQAPLPKPEAEVVSLPTPNKTAVHQKRQELAASA
jgi:hypothetical protein